MADPPALDPPSAPPHVPGLIELPVCRWNDETRHPGLDHLVVEEPIEFRVLDQPIATVMRTPGDDRDLALGFYFGEGVISSLADVGALSLCATAAAGMSGAGPGSGAGAGAVPEAAAPGAETAVPGARLDAPGNIVNLIPSAGCAYHHSRRIEERPLTSTSSCGICGKRTIEDILRTLPANLRGGESGAGPAVSAGLLHRLPESLRLAQPLFGRTGALHAAGIFDLEGRCLDAKEDIGRHNAVDKVAGAFLRKGQIPLRDRILVVSGRASFEIVQKALRAGIPFILAISGVSALAVDLARAGGLTLCGFARARRFTCYTGEERITRR